MPITIPDKLPAKEILESESIFVMPIGRAIHQDIRPLRLAILNLMPTKIATETQLLRCLSNSPLQVEVELMQLSSHKSKNTSAEHLLAFYKPFSEFTNRNFDGCIITGAPVEKLPFEEVDYWDELCEVFRWAQYHVTSCFHICWGAQAGMYFYHGVNKGMREEKLHGVYRHDILSPNSALLRGLDDQFNAPHSRYSETWEKDILKAPNIEILAKSPDAGVLLAADTSGRQVYSFGHMEYDTMTLAQEYRRDMDLGIHPKLPVNYFPEDNPNAVPVKTWRSAATLIFSNWLNYYVYQATPYHLPETGGLIQPEIK
jgi:homoserine O-succinyltransferase